MSLAFPFHAVEGDLIACGSESNELFVYFKALSKPIAWCNFATSPPGSSGRAEEGGAAGSSHACPDHSFISAVTWRPCSSTLVTANSLGTVKVLQLMGSATEADSD